MAIPTLRRSTDPAQPVVLTGRMWDQLCDIIERSSRIEVAWPLSKSEDPGGITLGCDLAVDDGFWAWSTAAAQDGSNLRWAYTFAEVEKTDAAYAGWATKSGGQTGTMYNTLEVGNGATGLLGVGVDTANLSGTYTLKPLPNNRPVWVRIVYRTTGEREYWCEYSGGIDGACS